MKITDLISNLQAIAAINPNYEVWVEDGMDPSDVCPITSIKPHTGKSNVICLDSDYSSPQPLNLDDFK